MKTYRQDRREFLMEAINDIDRRLQALEGETGAVGEKDERPSILDQDWYHETYETIPDRIVCIVHSGGENASIHKFKREIAALPDALRALVMVQKKAYACAGGAHTFLNNERLAIIDAALKKAGIFGR